MTGTWGFADWNLYNLAYTRKLFYKVSLLLVVHYKKIWSGKLRPGLGYPDSVRVVDLITVGLFC